MLSQKKQTKKITKKKQTNKPVVSVSLPLASLLLLQQPKTVSKEESLSSMLAEQTDVKSQYYHLVKT